MEAKAVNPLWVHAALVTSQLCFGCGAIVGKLGVHGGNPLVFALVRETVAGLGLLGISFFLAGFKLPQRQDVPRILVVGFALFLNQICYILGLKLADPVSGAAWQPMIPIFSTAFAVVAGYEHASANKVVGLFLAVGGAVFMVLESQNQQSQSAGGAARSLEGQFIFFLNCLATAGYIVLSKELLRKYHAAAVTSWAYLVAAQCMALSTLSVSRSPRLLAIVCQDGSSVDKVCTSAAWTVERSMLWPLVYWILFGSILAYFLVSWSNQHAKASVVSIYAVLQPMAAGLLAAASRAVMGAQWAARYDLRGLGPQDLGILPIMLGMHVLFREPTLDASCREASSVDEEDGKAAALKPGDIDNITNLSKDRRL